ncbi:Copia protein, partial [Mucuna pruriens]
MLQSIIKELYKPFFSKSPFQGKISMMEDNPCEFFELSKPPVPISTPPKVLNSEETPNSIVENSEETLNFTVEISEENHNSTVEIFGIDPNLNSNALNINSSIELELILPTDVLAESERWSTDELDLPIAIRKCTRQCTKILYPLSHYYCQKAKWRQVMKQKMNALERNNTWEIIDRPKGKKILLIASGYSNTSLVPKGYTQNYGVDYQETFAPVAKMNSLLQYDVKNAFLYGDLNEEIYMNILLEFEGYRDNKVYKLQKVMYGLK